MTVRPDIICLISTEHLGATFMGEDKYRLCSCGSGKKFKFCCYEQRAIWSGMSERELIRRAKELPSGQCYITLRWWDRGLPHVIVLREVPGGRVLMGSYLVDVFCLGVKDAYCRRLQNNEVPFYLDGCPDDLVEISFEDARSMILGAVEFARQFGFEPDDSWTVCSPLVEPERPFIRKFDFGKDGRPFYIQGPHDDVETIINKLAPFANEGNADYILAEDLDDESEFDDETEFFEWCEEVSSLMENKHFRDARKEIQQMLENYPERWEPFYLKGTCLAMEGKADQAIRLFNRAIAVEPTAETYLNLAGAHQSLFHIEEWITCLQKVVELDGAAGSFGHIARELIDEFAASIVKSYGISLDQYLTGAEIYDHAFRNLNAGHVDEAIRGFREVLKVLPHHVQSYGNLGLAYAGKGDRDLAIACLDRAIELDADYQPAIVNRRILLTAPDARLAVQSLKKIDFYGDRTRARSRSASARASGF